MSGMATNSFVDFPRFTWFITSNRTGKVPNKCGLFTSYTVGLLKVFLLKSGIVLAIV